MTMSTPEVLLALALGIALAAAVGLRVFIPLLAVSVAAYVGRLELSPTFEWLGTGTAVAAFAAAAIIEVAAYYIPGIDNVLDALMTPLALMAGTMMVVAPLWDLPPMMKWTVAVIAGGGAAGLTQGVTSLLRAKSTLGTGGLANPVVSTGELGGSILLTVLGLLIPVLALILLAVMLGWLLGRLLRKPANPRKREPGITI